MTHLERLIQAHVDGSVVFAISSSVEKIAEEIAREYLKDPQFKAEIQALVRRHADATIKALRASRNGRTPARRLRRKRTRA